eukprot:Ihof_evm8s229 gene=Ihof_evmTU8s229
MEEEDIVDDPTALKVLQLRSQLAKYGFEDKVYACDGKKSTLVDLYIEHVLPLKGKKDTVDTVHLATRSAQKRVGIQHQYPTPGATEKPVSVLKDAEDTPVRRSTRARTTGGSMEPEESSRAGPTRQDNPPPGSAKLSSKNMFQFQRPTVPTRLEQELDDIAGEESSISSPNNGSTTPAFNPRPSTPTGANEIGHIAAWKPISVAVLAIFIALTLSWFTNPCEFLSYLSRPIPHGQCINGRLRCYTPYEASWLPFNPCVVDPRFREAAQWRELMVREQALWLLDSLKAQKGTNQCYQTKVCLRTADLRKQVLAASVPRLDSHMSEELQDALWLDIQHALDPRTYTDQDTHWCPRDVVPTFTLSCAVSQHVGAILVVIANSAQATIGLIVVAIIIYGIKTIVTTWSARQARQREEEEEYLRATVQTLLDRLKVNGRLVIAHEKDEALPPTIPRAERQLGLRLWPQVEEMMRSTSIVRVKNELVNGQEVKVWRYA